MIPVFKLGDLKKRPNDPNARERAMEVVRALKQSDAEFRRICEEKGIPYVPAVAADPYGTRYYAPLPRRQPRTHLADVWNR